MGRPIGSANRSKAIRGRLASGNPLLNDTRHLSVIADKLAEKAEQGDLGAIQQIADRLDGKPSQAIERGEVPLEK